MMITWKQLQERDDVIGGCLEVFEGEPEYPQHWKNFRGLITAVDWEAPMPIFHLESVQRFEFSTQMWTSADAEIVPICHGVIGRHLGLCRSGEGLYTSGCTTRYLFTIRGVAACAKPRLPPPASYEEMKRIVLSVFNPLNGRRSILEFK